MPRVKDDAIAAIERTQKRVQAARRHVQEILRRQEERLKESRQVLDWLRK